MTGRRKDGRREADSDDALWARATRDTVPLKKRPARPPADPEPEPAADLAADRRKAPARRKAAAAPPAAPAGPPPLPPLEIGRAAGVDRRTADRLRRGRMAIDAVLDLHGHRRDEAHRALHDFVLGSVEAGRRCLLVITGKGGRSRGEGILRAALPGWLGEAPLRPHVLALHPARPEHGGDGAFYVLLRRRRGG